MQCLLTNMHRYNDMPQNEWKQLNQHSKCNKLNTDFLILKFKECTELKRLLLSISINFLLNLYKENIPLCILNCIHSKLSLLHLKYKKY